MPNSSPIKLACAMESSFGSSRDLFHSQCAAVLGSILELFEPQTIGCGKASPNTRLGLFGFAGWSLAAVLGMGSLTRRPDASRESPLRLMAHLLAFRTREWDRPWPFAALGSALHHSRSHSSGRYLITNRKCESLCGQDQTGICVAATALESHPPM